MPQGVAAADEVSTRVGLWESRQFEALLQRAEQQRIVIGKSNVRKKQAGPDAGAKSKRAWRVAV